MIITQKGKKKTYYAVFESIILSSSEILEINYRIPRRLQAVEMDLSRRSCELSRSQCIKNEDITSQLFGQKTRCMVWQSEKNAWWSSAQNFVNLGSASNPGDGNTMRTNTVRWRKGIYNLVTWTIKASDNARYRRR